MTQRMLAFVHDRRLFFILFLLLFPVLFRPRVYGFDPVGYYAWLRSAVIDGNLDTTDEYLHYGNDVIVGPTVTGYNHDPYAIGAPLLWSPFFVSAHLIETTRAAVTQSPPPDGYGDIYVWAVSIGSALYGLAAVLILHALTRSLFGEPTARIAAIAVWLASPLVFYMYSHPTMAHAGDAFVNALVFAAWIALGRRDTPRQWLFMGASIGLATLVRTQNAMLVVVPGLWLLSRVRGTFRSDQWRTWLQSIGAFALGGLIAFGPQIAVWRIVYGSWIELNPYSYTQDAGHFTGTFQVLRVLFSTDRGLFIWSPILLFAIAGLIPLYRRHHRLAVYFAFHFATQVLLVSSWSVYNGALSFGARLLLQSIPVYVFGLAAFVDWLRRRGWRTRALAAVGAGFIVWNFLLIAQYAVGTVPRTGEFPLGLLIAGQFTVVPNQIDRILQALLTRQ